MPEFADISETAYGQLMNEAVRQTKEAIDSGNLLLAYDLAQSAIEAGDDSKDIQHLIALTLARMGNADRAMDLYQQYGLDQSPDPHHRALVARILKDTALATDEANDRSKALLAASESYQALFDESGDAYPGINAATLAFLGGEKPSAESLARVLLDMPEVAAPSDFYAAATRAEAQCLLGNFDQAKASLLAASKMDGANPGSKSSCSRQLSLITDVFGFDDERRNEFLAPILPPSVIHYCGHMFLEDDPVEKKLRAKVDMFLDEHDVGFAYGALASGADIVVAEAILDRGGGLHVTLPFALEDFVAQSVIPAGDGWKARFDRCMGEAKRVNYATEMNYVGDPEQFNYGSKTAMGLAKLRSQYLGGSVRQLAIWDGNPPTGPAGTAADVVSWQKFGGETSVIDADGLNRQLAWPEKPKDDPYKRTVAAVLFTDFPGFSKLEEKSLPAFWTGVMGSMATVLGKHERKVLAQNSWGDALHAVTANAGEAARLALDIQAALQDFDYALLGLSETSGMRIGVHYGSAYETDDPITGKVNFYGTEVSKAARIEPVTPPGAVFMTEPFAAILALEAADEFQSQYVGKVEFAKDYGAFPIYRLQEK